MPTKSHHGPAPGQIQIPGYDEFELDVERVLKEQLPAFIDGVTPAPLTRENVLAVPARAKGAYLLLHRGRPVYAGKTDASHGFRNRLERHWSTLQHRVGLDLADMSFKAVRVMVFSNFDVETILIKEMRRRDPQSHGLPWNDSGFGSNDPGHNREAQEPAQFDKDWPVDIDRPLDFIQPGTHNVRDLLVKLKEGLPYLLRYETDLIIKGKAKPKPAKHGVGHVDQRESSVEIPPGPITTRSALTAIVAALPASQWQATIFPDRVILYKEPVDYPFNLSIIR